MNSDTVNAIANEFQYIHKREWEDRQQYTGHIWFSDDTNRSERRNGQVTITEGMGEGEWLPILSLPLSLPIDER